MSNPRTPFGHTTGPWGGELNREPRKSKPMFEPLDCPESQSDAPQLAPYTIAQLSSSWPNLSPAERRAAVGRFPWGWAVFAMFDPDGPSAHGPAVVITRCTVTHDDGRVSASMEWAEWRGDGSARRDGPYALVKPPTGDWLRFLIEDFDER